MSGTTKVVPQINTCSRNSTDSENSSRFVSVSMSNATSSLPATAYSGVFLGRSKPRPVRLGSMRRYSWRERGGTVITSTLGISVSVATGGLMAAIAISAASAKLIPESAGQSEGSSGIERMRSAITVASPALPRRSDATCTRRSTLVVMESVRLARARTSQATARLPSATARSSSSRPARRAASLLGNCCVSAFKASVDLPAAAKASSARSAMVA